MNRQERIEDLRKFAVQQAVILALQPARPHRKRSMFPEPPIYEEKTVHYILYAFISTDPDEKSIMQQLITQKQRYTKKR